MNKNPNINDDETLPIKGMPRDISRDDTVKLAAKPSQALDWTLHGPEETKEGRVWRIYGRTKIHGFSGLPQCRLADVYSIEKNARLMVAAPDLFAMLDLLVNEGECYCIGERTGCGWCEASALLKKIKRKT